MYRRQFIILYTEFLVFNAKSLVLNAKFILFTLIAHGSFGNRLNYAAATSA